MSIYISRVYTKGGDLGETSLVGLHRVRKDSPRIESYGNVDELNAVLGLVRCANQSEAGPQGWRETLEKSLARIQSELFNLGSLLSTLPEDLHPKQPRILPRHTQALEAEIDQHNAVLEPLRSFTVPGGGWVSSYLHLGRTVCRRAERGVVTLASSEQVDEEAIRYLNRLSDALYVFGRYNVKQRGETEPLWQPEATEGEVTDR